MHSERTRPGWIGLPRISRNSYKGHVKSQKPCSFKSAVSSVSLLRGCTSSQALFLRRPLSLFSLAGAALLGALPSAAANWYISPLGSPAGEGSISSPWDIATGLAKTSEVQAGDTVYLRAGNYVNSAAANGQIAIRYNGKPGNPVVVRAYPGERATIDARNFAFQRNILAGANFICRIDGQFCWVMDLEFTESSTQSRNSYSRINGVYLDSPGAGLINCVVHNVDVGILPVPSASPWIVYGNIVINNGWFGTGVGTPGHGIYAQNNSTVQVAQLKDNIVVDNFGYGLHLYATAAQVIGMNIEGNVCAQNGILNLGTGHGRTANPDILVGADPGNQSVDALVVRSNVCYQSSAGKIAYLGYGSSTASRFGNLTVSGNYFAGGVNGAGAPYVEVDDWTSATVTQNTFANARAAMNGADASFPAYTWNDNLYWSPANQFVSVAGNPDISFAAWQLASGYDANSTCHGTAVANAGTHVFVRLNAYESNRAHIVVFDWNAAGSAVVSLGGILPKGATYAIYNAQDYYGPAVLSGTYNGVAVTLPTIGLSVEPPVAWPAAPATGPTFNVFVVVGITTGLPISSPRKYRPVQAQ